MGLFPVFVMTKSLHQDARGVPRRAPLRSLQRFGGLCASASLLLSVAHAQGGNDAVLDQWADQTGERVEVGRSADGAVTWRASVSVDGYRRDVSTPGDVDLLTPNRSGDFHNATVSGEWHAKRPDERESHFQIANTHSSDPAVHSRYRNQITTLQGGMAGPSHRVAAGDVVANFSTLGASTGLRGTALQWRPGRHTVDVFGGVVSDSWETLFGVKPRTTAYELPIRKRNVYGMKFSTPLSERITAFATVQTFDDRVVDAGDPAHTDGMPRPMHNAQSTTVGAAYQRTFGGGQTLELEAEFGGSRADAETPGDRLSDRAFSLGARGAVPWRGGRYTIGAGHHDLGMDWTGMGAAALAGTRESYLSNGLQWDNGLSWHHDWREGLNQLPWGEDIYAATLVTSTHRLGWQPAWMNGGSIALHDIRSRTDDNAGADSRAHQTQAVVSLVHGDWQGSLQWGLSGQDFPTASGERTRLRDWQMSVGHSARDMARNVLRLASYSVNVFAGRQTHLTGTDGRMVVRSVGVDLSGFSPVWGGLSLTHSRQWARLTLGGAEVPTRSTTLSYSKALRSGLSLRLYANHLDQNAGLPHAQLSERTVGIQLSQTWP